MAENPEKFINIVFKERRGADRWTNILFNAIIAPATDGGREAQQRIYGHFDVIWGEESETGENKDKIGELMARCEAAANADNKENTLAIQRGEYSLRLEDHPGKHITALPWFYFTLSDQDVKYAFPTLKDRAAASPVIGKVVCCGAYLTYITLAKNGIDVRPATAAELDETTARNEIIILHDKHKTNLALVEAMKRAQLYEEHLFFESDVLPEPLDSVAYTMLESSLKHYRNRHEATLASYKAEDLEVFKEICDAIDAGEFTVREIFLQIEQRKREIEEFAAMIEMFEKVMTQAGVESVPDEDPETPRTEEMMLDQLKGSNAADTMETNPAPDSMDEDLSPDLMEMSVCSDDAGELDLLV
jgi:hypothetical protein